MTRRALQWTLALAAAASAVACFDYKMPDRAEADCVDPESDVCWQRVTSQETMGWLYAMDYCEAMGLGGYVWRLPSIDELRSLIDGCDETETDGACDVTEDCLDSSCATAECAGCGSYGGPGYGGCYWDTDVEGPCGCYWTSSPWDDYSMNAWAVGFDLGSVNGYDKNSTCYVRCVAGYADEE